MSFEHRKVACGFTLVETLVALLIVSLGMTAVFAQLNQFAGNAIYMQDKTLASWIASNRLTQLSIQTEWPELGDDEEEVEFANRLWTLTLEVTETDVENLRRADVSIALTDDPERIIHTVSALIEPPPPNGIGPAVWRSVGGRRGVGGQRGFEGAAEGDR